MAEAEIRTITDKLDVLTRLIPFSFLEGKKLNNQLYILSKAGFKPKEIAEMLGTTSNRVRVQLWKIRKGTKK